MNTLENVKQGDALALWNNRENLVKIIVERVTPTQITAGGIRYTRRGYEVGSKPGGYFRHRAYVEPWNESHDKDLIEIRAKNKLSSDRHKVREFDWRNATQKQVSAVLAAMAQTGCFDDNAG